MTKADPANIVHFCTIDSGLLYGSNASDPLPDRASEQWTRWYWHSRADDTWHRGPEDMGDEPVEALAYCPTCGVALHRIRPVAGMLHALGTGRTDVWTEVPVIAIVPLADGVWEARLSREAGRLLLIEDVRVTSGRVLRALIDLPAQPHWDRPMRERIVEALRHAGVHQAPGW